MILFYFFVLVALSSADFFLFLWRGLISDGGTSKMNLKVCRVSLGSMGRIGIGLLFDDDGMTVLGAYLTGSLPANNMPTPGKYPLVWDDSTPKHPTGIYRMVGVPNCPNDELHPGDYFGDTAQGFLSDVTGCTLLASTIGMQGKQVCIRNSDVTYAQFLTITKKQNLTIEITDGGSLFDAA